MLSNIITCFNRVNPYCRPLKYAIAVGIALISAGTSAQTAPIIYVQPQSQTVTVGSNVTVSVAAGPVVSSGTLKLWLRADEGVVTNASGQVSKWQDQSGNGNDAVQANANNQPSLVYPAGIGGLPTLRFNGNPDNVHGSYMAGTGDVGVPNAMTTFAVYNYFSTDPNGNEIFVIGQPPAYGSIRTDVIYQGDMYFSTWAYDYPFPFLGPSNTYRIWTTVLNTNLSTVDVYDNSATNANSFTASVANAVAPAPGYYVGGINPAIQYVVNNRCFAGDIAELICYRGQLTDADRLAVLNYLQQKYYMGGSTNGLSFQWQFDGTNISDATNATLTLPDVQTNDAGTYAVIVTDPAGSTISSNAVLTVNLPLPCAPAAAGLVGWWPAEGNADDIVAGNNGTLINGVSFGTGEVGQGFDLTGNSQYVVIPDAPALRPASLTVEGWCNIQASDGVRALVAKPYGPGIDDSYTVWIQNGSLLGAVATSGGEQPFLQYNWSPTLGTWHHVAYTYDAARAVQTLYVDGALVALSAASGAISYDTHPFQIGADIENGAPSFFFDGSIDELSLYDRALAATEIAAIYNAGAEGKCGFPATIVTQPQSENALLGSTANFSVTAGGAPPITYQWSFDGTNISGATGSTLVLTNVGPDAAGSYMVALTNAFGSALSSNAVLAVGNSPSITIEPQSQQVTEGTNITLSVGTTGTAPLSFQWSFNGSVLPLATNSSLNLTDVQATNAGSYDVSVSSPFGVAVSSNAVLTIALLPDVVTQPQSVSVVVGSNVSLSVAVAGSASLQSSLSSGTLRLWLKSDAGVIANPSGLISQWQDQSGNANNASQANTNNQPTLVYPPGLGGLPALRFNGNPDNVHGSYMAGTGDVGVPDAMTTFAVYNYFSTDPNGNEIFVIGQPPAYGSIRSDVIYQGEMYFSTWAYDYGLPFLGPSNTYRIWTTVLDSNLSSVNVYDNSATTTNSFSASVFNAVAPAPGFYVGGLNPAVQYVVNNRCFAGDIAELICYRGQLSDPDRLEVLNYLQQKYYYPGDTNGVSFQWEFDGTNIAGATNATLTLTNVQGTDAGTYTVTVTDAAGSTTSSNAVLTTLFPAAITSSPTNQSVSAGTSVTFTAAATGTAPLSLQWQFDGTNIFGATNTSLTVSNAVVANAGSYAMVASNPYGTATSSPATLSVDESTVQVVSTSATGGGTVVVSIDLVALGTESGVGFTLNFDPTVLTYVGASAGSGASGTGLNVNPKYASFGQLVCVVAQPVGTFAIGTNDLFDITFQIAVVTNAVTTSVTFGNQFTHEQVSDPSPQVLPAVFMPGVVIISPTELEGDVSPRFTGDEVLSVTDWIQEGRFVAGLDTITDPSEFQRADCAPRSTLGDGQLTVADWAQVGRYVADADQPTAAGGPSTPQPQVRKAIHPIKDGGTPALTLVPLTQGAQTNSVSVQLSSQGEVNSLGFSVSFNPAMIQFVNASLGASISNATYIPNTGPATNGSVGFLVGLLSGTFPAGNTPLVNLTFAPVAYSNITSLVFSDAIIGCEMVDTNTAELSANFVNAALTVGGSPWPALSIVPSGDSIALSWPSSATGLRLQSASSLDGTWSDVAATPAINGDSMVFTTAAPTNTIYYRLKY